MPNFPIQQLYDERARALAIIILTRRDDLVIAAGPSDFGPDLLVSIDRGDKPRRIQFAIFLGATAPLILPGEADHLIKPTIARFQAMEPSAYPICSFLFSMRSDDGHFAWLTEPVVDGSTPRLDTRPQPQCVPLTDAVLDDVVDRVVAWHHAVEATVMA